MPVVSLPDGSKKVFDTAVTIADITSAIDPALAKAALAAKVDGILVDCSHRIEEDASLEILTVKTLEGLDILRHSTAHLLAHAVKRLFPNAQVTIGPIIEDGFYYDFYFERSFTPEDLLAIEKMMFEIISASIPVTRKIMRREAAIDFFKAKGELYKAELIAGIPDGEVLSLYEQGDFIDLCRGPHAPSTGHLSKAFKLTKIAGAYWRGDSNREMLQRIYGTTWPDQKALKQYLLRLEEAEKRDHRRLGRQLNLFHFQEEAPGMVFWHSKGWTLYQTIKQYMRSILPQYGYREVNTPLVIDQSLWERSGHWDNFHECMFFTEQDERHYAIKPMNCPGHVQIYNQGLKSYRDLPLKMAEFGLVHRYEPSGALHGLMRLRAFVQDDAHVFCSEAQLQSEVSLMISMLFDVYQKFSFDNIILKLSTRPKQRVGSDDIWDRAERALEEALNSTSHPWSLSPGDGAFYGPKIEFALRDSIGRIWQCGTVQVDFSMLDRLGARYVAEDNSKQIPVMIHRAIFGSLERFIGILIEHYAGKFPYWLAPVQAVILTITDEQRAYAEKLFDNLLAQNIRVQLDTRNEKIGFKIREHALEKTPFFIDSGCQRASCSNDQCEKAGWI